VDHESKLQPADPLDAFFDYNKMALQFGFVSMFCAAFPLAPVCALGNNILEIRTDAAKRLLGMQRPAPSVRAENVGAWMQIFELISLIAVATNIGVLCFTSDRLATLMGFDSSQQVWAFVIIEHGVLVIKLLMAFAIADVPEWVTLRGDRDAYMLMARDEIVWREEQKERDKKNTIISAGSLSIKKSDAGPVSSSDEFAHMGSGTGAAPVQDYGSTLSIL